MSELHQRIINLPCHAPYEAGEQLAARVVYREGHRDARHAAAELANEADAEISRLRDTQRVLVEALEGLMEVERRGRVMPIGAAWDAARAALASVEQPEQRRQPFQLNPPPVYDQHYAATQSEVEQQEPSEDAREVPRG